MEEIQISKDQEKKLLSLVKESSQICIVFFIVGLSGLIPTIISFFGDAGPNYFYSTSFVFFIIGLVFWLQYKEAIKLIEAGDYQTYKAVCKKIGWEYASIDNNEILSKNVTKATKKVAIFGTRKSMQAGDEIGILKVGKEFRAFPLNICEAGYDKN